MTKEMQRDRPPPLRVNRPQIKPQNRRPLMVVQTQALQYRQPLIIHTFSPEVIQTEARDFMHLVQRLTGQGSHVSPLAKRPRHASAISLTEQLLDPGFSNGASQVGPSISHPLEQQRSTEDLGLQRGSSPSRSGLQTSLSPYNRGAAGGISLRSPRGFEFSPSMLPSPATFFLDFPNLLSPHAAGLPSPRLARSPLFPGSLRSPGPLTSAFLADLPVLSPAAYQWIEKHPLSAESILSPRPRALGLPPRPPTAEG